MITVTDQALELLDSIRNAALAQAPAPREDGSEPALRLVIQNSQAGLALDQPRGGDQVFEREGRPVLLVDSEVGQALSGVTMGVQATEVGDQLTLERAEESGLA